MNPGPNDIVWNAFEKQAEFLNSKAWGRGCFASKRCISPESKVLTSDGVISFGDISEGIGVLSFDQKANQFLLAQNTASFPKTKCSGYRVVHEQGEFVVSGEHLIFCSDYVYRSVRDVKRLFDDANCTLSFLCPSLTIEELAQKWWPSNVHHLTQKPANYLDYCAVCNYQYDLPPQRALIGGPALSQPLSCVQESSPPFSQETFLYEGAQDHRKLKCSHLDQGNDLSSNLDAMALAAYQCAHDPLSPLAWHTSEQWCCSIPSAHQSHDRTSPHRNGAQFHQLTDRLSEVSACDSRILEIERVSNKWWWDVHIFGTNNYVSGGAIHHNSGKTESFIVDCIREWQEKPNFSFNGRDHWTAGLIEPTSEMMRKILIPKFEALAKPLIKKNYRTDNLYILDDDSLVYLGSGDKPNRWEGGKYNALYIDEVFQQKEHLFDECYARVLDSEGRLTVGGSLGTNIVNPKQTWVYRRLIENPPQGFEVFEWATIDNPHIKKEMLQRAKEELDPVTYRQMFEIHYDIMAGNRVYDDFTEDNILESHTYDPKYPTYVSIDWGWAHPMAVGFYQKIGNRIVLFDEIVSSKLKREALYEKIMAKGYRISAWVCDLAGTQERESNISNVEWFRKKGIHFKYRSSKILYGVSVVRSWILNNKGVRRFYITRNCPKHIDGMLNYSYQEKDGQILNENPMKKDDDCVDSVRYLFVNLFDDRRNQPEWNEHKRWDWEDAARIRSS